MLHIDNIKKDVNWIRLKNLLIILKNLSGSKMETKKMGKIMMRPEIAIDSGQIKS